MTEFVNTVISSWKCTNRERTADGYTIPNEWFTDE